MAYSNGLSELRLSVAALGLARPRTDSPKHPWEEVGNSIDVVRSLVSSLEETSDVRRHIGERGARILTRDVDAYVVQVCGIEGVIRLVGLGFRFDRAGLSPLFRIAHTTELLTGRYSFRI
jgi:hypothetical protein